MLTENVVGFQVVSDTIETDKNRKEANCVGITSKVQGPLFLITRTLAKRSEEIVSIHRNS
jgi:hypothetical protein